MDDSKLGNENKRLENFLLSGEQVSREVQAVRSVGNAPKTLPSGASLVNIC